MRITRPTTDATRLRSVHFGGAGFTLLEMLSVVLIIGILVSLLCAALNHTKTRALRVTCLDNMKQLQQAWWLYAADNEETLPLNQTAPDPQDARFPQLQSSTNSWVAGNPLEDIDSANIKRGTLYTYINAPATYRCPMDDSTLPRHPDISRSRSYAMNSYLGGDADLLPQPKYKFGQLGRPDNIFVFIEEHESSRWHSSFLVPPAVGKGRISAASSAVWWSTPSDRHAQGCNISFADGHIEYWPWYAPKEPVGDNHAASSSPSIPQTRDFVRLQSCLP